MISPEAAEAAGPGNFESITAFAETAAQTFMAEEDIAGLGIALVSGPEQLWSAGFGLAARQPETPFTERTGNTLHELAKLFTAVAVMQLVEQGKVSLDAPFNQYFPDFRPYASGMTNTAFTVRHLLSHHSGLPSEYSPGFELEPDAGDLSASHYRDILDKHGDIAFIAPPGELYGYSYLGYVLLGLLVEQVSGLDYADYVQRHILDPLGMRDTGFGWTGSQGTILSNAFDGKKEVPQSRFRDLSGNGLVSSARDMAVFMQALVTGGRGVISPTSLAEMFRDQNSGVVLDAGFRIGLGFFTTPSTGGAFRQLDTISHGSDIGQSQSYFIGIPDRQLAVMVSANTVVSTAEIRRLAEGILEQMLPADAGAGLSPWTPHAEVDLDRADADRLAGVYSGAGGIYDIVRRGNRLKMRIEQFPFFNLTVVPREDDFYGIRIRLFGFIPLSGISMIAEFERSLEFNMIEVGGDTLLQWYYQGTPAFVSMTEITPLAQSPALDVWRSRTGLYQSGTVDGESTLEYKEEHGVFLFGRKPAFMGFDAQPAQIYCGLDETTLRHCGKGMDPPGIKNQVRLLPDGRLLDAYGNHYSRR